VLPVVVAALHAVGGGFAAAVHARSWLYTAQLRFPRPDPATQDLLSGDSLVVRADGGADSPPAMAVSVGRHPALAAALSECRVNPRSAAPCGVCPECTLMALAFLASGSQALAPSRRVRTMEVAKLPFANAVLASDAEATVLEWSGGRHGLRRILRMSAGLAHIRSVIRDHVRWAQAAMGLIPPWPR